MYENLDDARAALEALLADGERNVDIGLMQVNWGMNGYRAERASDLLIPRHNVMVGARILRDAMVVHDGDLAKALEDYHHRPDSERGQRYSAEVRLRLEKLRAVPGITRALSGGSEREVRPHDMVGVQADIAHLNGRVFRALRHPGHAAWARSHWGVQDKALELFRCASKSHIACIATCGVPVPELRIPESPDDAGEPVPGELAPTARAGAAGSVAGEPDKRTRRSHVVPGTS